MNAFRFGRVENGKFALIYKYFSGLLEYNDPYSSNRLIVKKQSPKGDYNNGISVAYLDRSLIMNCMDANGVHGAIMKFNFVDFPNERGFWAFN